MGVLRLLFDYLNERDCFVDWGISGVNKVIIHRKCPKFDLKVTVGGDYLGTAFGEGICGQHPQFPAAHRSSHITQGSKLKKAVHWREGLACPTRPAHAAPLESHSPARYMGGLTGLGNGRAICWHTFLIRKLQSTPDQATKGVLILDLTSFRWKQIFNLSLILLADVWASRFYF